MRFVAQLLRIIRFRRETLDALERMTHRAKVAEHRLRDYDRRLANALVTNRELEDRLERAERVARRVRRNPDISATAVV